MLGPHMRPTFSRTHSPREHASLLTETILLGNVAIHARVPLVWDGPKFHFTTGAREATRLVRWEHRKGWTA